MIIFVSTAFENYTVPVDTSDMSSALSYGIITDKYQVAGVVFCGNRDGDKAILSIIFKMEIKNQKFKNLLHKASIYFGMRGK